MSDQSLKDYGQQAQEKLTPQSKKSTSSVLSENISGTSDKLASSIQPDCKKSGAQETVDKARGSTGSQEKGSSYLESAKNKLSSAAETVTKKTKDTQKSAQNSSEHNCN